MGPLKRWLLRQRLSKAEHLRRREVINEWQYAYFAVRTGFQALGERLRPGTDIRRLHFEWALAMADMVIGSRGLEEITGSTREYGPYPDAVGLLSRNNAFMWAEGGDQAAMFVLVRLHWWNRLGYRIQEWIQEQTREFPVWWRVAAWIASTAAGFIVGRMTAR
jgi:hypothetical protein